MFQFHNLSQGSTDFKTKRVNKYKREVNGKSVIILRCLFLVAACRSVNGVLQKQLTEEKNNKEMIIRHRDQLSQVRKWILQLQKFI